MSLKLTGNGLFEASRMMLPEHKEAYNAYRKGVSRMDRPELDEQEIERMSLMLAEALQEALQVRITLYDPYEQRELMVRVMQIDAHFHRVKLATTDEYYWVPWEEIINVTAI